MVSGGIGTPVHLDELYAYDEVYRLVGTDRGNLIFDDPDPGDISIESGTEQFAQDWGLDGLGNFGEFKENSDGEEGWEIDQDRTVNEANEIETITGGWVTPEYDNAGNMVSGPKPGAETTRLHFVYDAWNRQVAVKADVTLNPGEPGDVIVEYSYDGAGRRITKTYDDGAQTEYFYNQGWQMLEERVFDEEAQPVEWHAYVWSLRYVDAPILRDWYDDEGTLDADERLYYLNDANFNVTALVGLVDEAWTVVERYVYDPYGKATVYDADWSTNPQSPIPNPFRYCGYFFDAETALYNVRWRIYHSTLSTWLTRDPIAADVSSYRYCRNAPLTQVDPSGNWGADVHRDMTLKWADVDLGYSTEGAEAIADWDIWTDALPSKRSPWPIPGYADQSYHFDGDRGTGAQDTRKAISAAYIADAKKVATERPEARGRLVAKGGIAQRVGIALHAIQDWVAHGDHGMYVPKGEQIWVWHNSRTPQTEFGNPGNYPDDPELDVVDSPDGRPTASYLKPTWAFRPEFGWPPVGVQSADYACYEKGTKRIKLTEKLTKDILRDFKRFLTTNNEVPEDVRHFFLG